MLIGKNWSNHNSVKLSVEDFGQGIGKKSGTCHRQICRGDVKTERHGGDVL